MVRGLIILFFIAVLTAGCAVPLHQINGESPTADVIVQCEPENTKMFLDGVYIGKASQFDDAKHPLKVLIGAHVIQFELEDYQIERREILTDKDVQTIQIKMKLRPGSEEEEDKE